MIKPRIISAENEDEDEDAGWKAVYELHMITASWYETLKYSRRFLYASIFGLHLNISSHR